MANILQINSRKGLVQLSHDELAELNLLKWIRTSFRGIGRDGFIEVTPFESIAAEMYVQKYKDTQVDLATKCTLEADGSVSIILRTYSEPENRYYNTAENSVVITKHETKEAKFFHRERKKKFNSLKQKDKLAIYSGDFGGGQVQTLQPITSQDGKVSYSVGTTKNTISIEQTAEGQPLINGWPDVKGVDMYPSDVVLLISDFSGFVGHSNLRSPEMPAYDTLIQEPEGKFYNKFPASRSYLSDFDKTMVLLDLTARRKGDIDYTRIFIDDDVWNQKYKSKINESLYGQFEFNSYKEFVAFLNDVNFSSASDQISADNPDDKINTIANNYDKKSLFSSLLNEIDLKDTYINHVPSVMQLMVNPKNTNKIKTVAMDKVETPAYLKDALSNIFSNKNDGTEPRSIVPMEELLASIQEKFVDSNLKKNYEEVNVHLAEVMLKKEMAHILKYLSSEEKQVQEQNYKAVGEIADYKALLDPANLRDVNINEDYTAFIIGNYPQLSPNSDAVLNYNKCVNYLIAQGAISNLAEVEEIRMGFSDALKSKPAIGQTLSSFNSVQQSAVSSQAGLANLQGILDFLINFDTVSKKEFQIQKPKMAGSTNIGVESITFDETPFKFIENYISNFGNIYQESTERKYVNFNDLPRAEKESALESIGYGKEPMNIEEFMTRCPDAREYENLWITNWTNSSAEDKSRKLKEAFDLDREVNPDFTNTLLGDEQSGLRGTNSFKEKALLDYHRYKMEKDGAEQPLNLVSTDRDNPDQYREAKKEFSDWMRQYVSNAKANSQDLINKKEEAIQQLNANPENNPEQQKQLISYYDDKIKEVEEAGSTSWEDYLNYTNAQTSEEEGTVEGRKSNEKRQLAKVLGFTTYDDLTLPDNIDRITDYVKDYIIDSYNLNVEYDAADIDKLVMGEIGHLRLEAIKRYLLGELADEGVMSEPDVSNPEGMPLSYEAFRSTIFNLYNKLGIADPASQTPDSLLGAATAGTTSNLINRKENTFIVNLVKAAKSYVEAITKEYTLAIQSIDDEISNYDDNNVSEENADVINQLMSDRAQIQQDINSTNNLYGHIFSTIPDEIVSQYGLLSVGAASDTLNPNALFDSAVNGKLPGKTAAVESPMSPTMDSAYSNYLVRPEIVNFIQERLPSIGMKKDLEELVNEIAPEVQKEFINQYVETHPEVFGNGFVEDQGFDATAGNQDIWAVVSLLNPGKREGLFLVTPDQLLKVDASTIDTFYDKEVKMQNPGSGSEGFTPYFTSEQDKTSYDNNSYQKAITDYKDTEKYIDSQSSMKGVRDSKNKGIDISPEYTEVDKYKAGPIENYKSQLTQFRAELENIPSVKKDVDRLNAVNEKLQSNVEDPEEYKALASEQAALTKYIEPIEKKRKLYEKKIEDTKKKIQEFTPAYSVEDHVKEKSTKLKKDISEYNDLVARYKALREDPAANPEEVQRFKNTLLKRKEMVEMQQKNIKDLKENGAAPQSATENVAAPKASDDAQIQQELLERRRELQPKKYQTILSDYYRTASIKSRRKAHWLTSAMNNMEADMINSYIKVASSNDEVIDLGDISAIPIEPGHMEMLEQLIAQIDPSVSDGSDDIIIELSNDFIDELDAAYNSKGANKSYDTYNDKGSLTKDTTNKGKNVDISNGSGFKNIETFQDMLNQEIKKVSSYDGANSFYNTNQQAISEGDGDIEEEQPTSNDTSSIKSKRVSSVVEQDDLIDRISEFLESVQSRVDDILSKDKTEADADEIAFMEEYTELLSCLENLLAMQEDQN
jgi:hypothetical protein